MSVKLSHWGWVAVAWGQLFLTYVLYLLYLRHLERRATEGNEER